ncbi:protein kinase [Trypanosoma conorhini]|uniref:[RNA-polymerase]-subunit kinase n=1 Tax=Trypanosoma conorhini TaxID=83891 RepID=A0A422PPU5_9TRYP|nr:protein kinase [Trypanosoma conorhini]RNF19765.1 protein kinase [Trypanosoma conorhini]
MDRYIIGAPIGEGRFGVVRAAVVKDSGMPAAIKFLTMSRLDEGIPHPTARELLVAMRLVHPFIIRTYEIFPAGCSLALVMERCKGDLAVVLSGRSPSNPLPAWKAKSLFKMLLLALAYMHSEGVLHRDVKPSNCFLTEEGELRLGDFGLSRVWEKEASMTHEVVSRWYRAPELLLGQRHYGTEIDMWSSGCVFAELLRGYSGAFFAGDGEIWQLSRIFDVLGTPTPKSWPSAVLLPDWGKVHFEPKSPRSLRAFFPDASDFALDLLQQLLCLNPQKRLTAAAALRHAYFSEDPT